MKEKINHKDHGRSGSGEDPDDPDCPCRQLGSDPLIIECADAGCGFCKAEKRKDKRAILDVLQDADPDLVLEVLEEHFNNEASNCYDEDLFEAELVYKTLAAVVKEGREHLVQVSDRADEAAAEEEAGDEDDENR